MVPVGRHASAAATAAGCRCRGPGPGHRSGSRRGDAQPWLPQPAGWADLSVEAQEARPRTRCSALYRGALRLRRDLRALGAGTGADVTWLELGDDVVAFSREPGFVCAVNCGSTPVPLPAGTVLVGSEPLDLAPSATASAGRAELPADTGVWLAV